MNLTILVPEQQTIDIPVSCVEQGRWRYARRACGVPRPNDAWSAPRTMTDKYYDPLEFYVSRQTLPSDLRARKAQQLFRSRLRTGEPRADQANLWFELDRKRMAMDVHSPTGAVSDIDDRSEVTLADYERAFRAAGGQVGALFSINGHIVGMDAFDCARTLSHFFPKLVRSYALDAIELFQTDFVPVSSEAVEQFLRRVAGADSETFPGVGEGEDVRFRAAGIVGSALIARGKVAHLCAFREPDDSGEEVGDTLRRRRRAFWR